MKWLKNLSVRFQEILFDIMIVIAATLLFLSIMFFDRR